MSSSLQHSQKKRTARLEVGYFLRILPPNRSSEMVTATSVSNQIKIIIAKGRTQSATLVPIYKHATIAARCWRTEALLPKNRGREPRSLAWRGISHPPRSAPQVEDPRPWSEPCSQDVRVSSVDGRRDPIRYDRRTRRIPTKPQQMTAPHSSYLPNYVPTRCSGGSSGDDSHSRSGRSLFGEAQPIFDVAVPRHAPIGTAFVGVSRKLGFRWPSQRGGIKSDGKPAAINGPTYPRR